VVDLVQIIRPWVVVDVTPPAVGQAAPSAGSVSPSNINIGKVVAPSSVQSTSGNYSYDLVCYMHSVVKEKGSSD
jgi:hypothetical protein